MVDLQAKWTLSGNFFTHDPGKTLYANLRDMLDAVAAEMETEVKRDILSRQGEMPYWTGRTLGTVEGYTTSKKTGKRWATWAAVGTVTAGMGKADAIRTKAAAATIERRFHPFRKVKQGIYRSRALLSANLAKNLE